MKGVAAGVVTAAAVGVVAALAAPVVGTAAVTAGLGALAITGAVALGVTSGIDISNHNWAGLAYNAGNVLGGAVTGFAGGARVATAIEPNRRQAGVRAVGKLRPTTQAKDRSGNG